MNQLCLFLRDNVINLSNPEKFISDRKIEAFCEKVDIDKDGLIDYHD